MAKNNNHFGYNRYGEKADIETKHYYNFCCMTVKVGTCNAGVGGDGGYGCYTYLELDPEGYSGLKAWVTWNEWGQVEKIQMSCDGTAEMLQLADALSYASKVIKKQHKTAREKVKTDGTKVD